MLDDVKYWADHQTFAPDEIAVRLHHRLVEIHPFPNGNGRHARLMADLLVQQLGGQPFSWGSGSLKTVGELRKRYVEALKMADHHDIQPLIQFARS
jgi:Fic-DOC domain mobile mystery protein B